MDVTSATYTALIVRQYTVQDPGNVNPRDLGRSLNTRMKWLHLLQGDKLIRSFVIQRQIEDVVTLYESALLDIFEDLRDGSIDYDAFADRVTHTSIAAYVLAFAEGSETELPVEVLESLRLTLDSAGEMEYTPILEDLFASEEAVRQLYDMIDARIHQPVADLAFSIDNSSDYERFRRLVMWLVSIYAVYSLGQLYLPDDVMLQWMANPTKDSCGDCLDLDGQVHSVLEWRLWYFDTGKKPQSHELECGGWHCGCIYIRSSAAGAIGELPLI